MILKQTVDCFFANRIPLLGKDSGKFDGAAFGISDSFHQDRNVLSIGGQLSKRRLRGKTRFLLGLVYLRVGGIVHHLPPVLLSAYLSELLELRHEGLGIDSDDLSQLGIRQSLL